MKRFLLGLAIVFMSLTLPSYAQDNICEDIVLDAYQQTQDRCEATSRNQACYGNSSLTAQPIPNVIDFVFNVPGDIVQVGNLQSIRLSQLNQTTGEWGISLMRVQASLSADTPQDNIDLLLFGDVSLTQQAGSGAMQAFTFQTGVNDRPCNEAPDSGLLIQTPRGAGNVTLLVNEVIVELGSTAYLQAQANGEMVVNVIQGRAILTAFGKTVIVPAGARSRIPLNALGGAAAAPGDPEPYDDRSLISLPIVLLSQPVSIAPSNHNLSAQPLATEEAFGGALQWYRTFDVYACSYLGGQSYQWYQAQAPVNENGAVIGEYTIVAGPFVGAYQPGCPYVTPVETADVWDILPPETLEPEPTFTPEPLPNNNNQQTNPPPLATEEFRND